MGDFHEIVGDLTREQLNSDPYQCGVDVGRAVFERYPRLCHGQGFEEVGVCVRGRFKDGFTIPRVRELGDGNLYYDRARRQFVIEYSIDLDYGERCRIVALSLGLALVTAEDKVSMGMRVDASRTNMLFAEGFADGFLRGDVCDSDELELAMRLSADVRSRVKDALAGGDASHARRGAVSRGGVPVLVAGSAGSGKRVVDGCVESSGIGSGRAVAARDSVSRPAARPDSVLSLNGHTVKVYNCDGVPLSTVIDGRSVSLVNERTGERVRVPTRASHVFFVGGVVLFHYPNWGEPDLVFDDGWVGRNWFPACGCCGAPVVVDGDACDACNNNEFLCW